MRTVKEIAAEAMGISPSLFGNATDAEIVQEFKNNFESIERVFLQAIKENRCKIGNEKLLELPCNEEERGHAKDYINNVEQIEALKPILQRLLVQKKVLREILEVLSVKPYKQAGVAGFFDKVDKRMPLAVSAHAFTFFGAIDSMATAMVSREISAKATAAQQAAEEKTKSLTV
jgi:hypothetical protein